MKRILAFNSILLVVLALASFSTKEGYTVNKETPVRQILEYFGEKPASHSMENITKEIIQQGKDLVLKGKATKKSGKKTKLQSKHFKCTSCHNVVNDEGDLTTYDSQARLDYCEENDLPFLQGTSLYGVVNRSTFYNGDYQKKYADNPRIEKANTDIKEAIQLCAVECAQGRPFKKWELDAVLAYLWSLELKLGDLDMNDEEFKKIKSAGETDGKEIISLLKSKYKSESPATFGKTPNDAKAGFSGITGNSDNGKKIYDLGCMHCHGQKKYSMYELDGSKMTFRHLKRHIPRYDRYSIYQVSRYGAPSHPGKRAYMPQYSLDKMTDQHLEDLRAYIDEMSK